MRKGILALIGMILTLVFIIVALVGPWFTMSGEIPLTGKVESSWSLTSASYTSGGTPQTIKYADLSDKGLNDLFNIIMYLTIFALIVAILAVIFILMYVFNFGKPTMMKNLGVIFVVITFIIALVATFYFMTSFPEKSAIKTSGGATIGFWYSESVSGYTASGGPGFAWYLILIAWIIALISLIFVYMDKQGAPVYKAPPAQ